MHPIVVFAGPSMSHDEAHRLVPDAIVLPPVCQGDFAGAVERHRPGTVVVLDGEFGQNLSVWHKEIVVGLAAGLRVIGASSMGALRAAELEAFGMEGVGEVFRFYRDGWVTSDADVALLHGDADTGWRALTWPLVNVRATLAALTAAGTVDAATAATVEAVAAGLHFTDRVRPALAAALLRHGRADGAYLAGLVADAYVDQKHLDAREALTVACRPRPAMPSVTEPVAMTAENLPGFLWEALAVGDTVLASSRPDLRGYEFGNDVALHHPDYQQLLSSGISRRAMLCLADVMGLEAEPELVARTDRSVRTRLGIDDATLPGWLAANDLTAGQLDELIAEEARVNAVRRATNASLLFDGPNGLIATELRLRGTYPAAVKSAARRRQLAARQPAATYPADDRARNQLVREHAHATGWPFGQQNGFDATPLGEQLTLGLLRTMADAANAREEAMRARQRLAAVLGPLSGAVSAPDTAEHARQLHAVLESHQAGSVLLAVLEVGVADHLVAGPATAAELAVRCGADPDRLERLLHAAVGLGLLSSGPDGWRLTDAGQLLTSAHPESFVPLARETRARTLPALAALADVVRGTEPAHTGQVADTDHTFGVFTLASGTRARIAATFEPAFDGEVIDVGGGLGKVATAIAERCPAARVIVIEQGDTVQRARDQLAGGPVVVHTAASYTGRARRAVMSRVLLNLAEPDAVALLRRVHAWLEDGGSLLVADARRDDDGSAGMLDLLAMVRTGGAVRTGAQWHALARAGGFAVGTVTPLYGPLSLMEFRRIDPTGETP